MAGLTRRRLDLLETTIAQQAAGARLLQSPEWIELRTAMLEALMPYPEARFAVAARLATLGAAADHAGGADEWRP